MSGFTYDSYDLDFSEDGDLKLTNDNDLKGTFENSSLAIIQSIKRRVSVLSGSWRSYPKIGTNIDPFSLSNTEEDSELWNDAVIVALTEDGLIDQGDLEVETFPVTYNTWMTVITLNMQPTDENENTGQVRIFSVISKSNQARFYY